MRRLLYCAFALVSDPRDAGWKTRGSPVRSAYPGLPLRDLRSARPARSLPFLPGIGIMRSEPGTGAPVSGRARAPDVRMTIPRAGYQLEILFIRH